MFNVPNTVNPWLLLIGKNLRWLASGVNGNAGGGIPYGYLRSRRENPTAVYGRMMGPPTTIADNRNVVGAPLFYPSVAIARNEAAMGAEIERARALGYWSMLGGNPPPIGSMPVNRLENPLSTDPNLDAKILYR